MNKAKLSALMLTLALVPALTWAQADSDREKFHQAMKSCMEENGISRPEPGQRPSEEDRATLNACLKEKGVQPPKFDGRRKGPPPPQRERGSGAR